MVNRDGALFEREPLALELAQTSAEPVVHVRLRLRFRLGLALVAFATLLLPAVYAALVALTIYGVALHTAHDAWLMERANLASIIAYFGPLVVGCVVVIFMAKPFLARPARAPSEMTIRREQAPLLFQLVERIRNAVGAPQPREICIDTRVNASAGFRSGIGSLFRRADLALTIGTPLLAGLTLRQLAGVLAHEMGHFAQGGGMRLDYLIRSVNHWLVRVAYERDSWDDGLARAAKTWDFRIAIVLRVAIFAVWLSRKLLGALALFGRAMGTFMLREMELDADRYEVALVGGEVFESTALRVRVLAVARQEALAVSMGTWREGSLCEDLGELVAGLADRYTADERGEIQKLERDRKQGLFDTHPPDGQRIASAKAAGSSGTFRLEGPASALLGDNPEVSRQATVRLYQSEPEIRTRPYQLRPAREFLGLRDARQSEHETSLRYFGGLFDLMNPLEVARAGSLAPDLSFADGRDELHAARETAVRLRPAPAGDGSAALTKADATTAIEATAEADAALSPARVATRERLVAALSLAHRPEVAARLPEASAVVAEIDRLCAVLVLLSAESDICARLATAHDELVGLFDQLSRGPEAEKLAAQTLHNLARLHIETHQLEQRLTTAAYPFPHAGPSLSVSTFVVRGLPYADGTSGDTLLRNGQLLRRLQDLHARILGRLATLAEQIETAIDGLP
jgi:Zn-dependent protease with chaperone function